VSTQAPPSSLPAVARRLAAALLALTVWTTASVVSSTLLAAPASAATNALPVCVSLSGVSPVSLAPGTVMTVTGTVRNTGRTTLTSLQVILRLDWRVITDRRELAEWETLDERDPDNGTRQNGVPLSRSLPPGATAPFNVTMRGEDPQLPVNAKGFGPRKMAIEIQNGRGGNGPRVGILRTFTVWNPVRKYSPTRLAMLVPVTSGHQPVDPTGSGAQVPTLWEPQGRLARLLTATADRAFTYAIDPSLVTKALRDQTPQPLRPRGRPEKEGAHTPSASGTKSSAAPSGAPSGAKPPPGTSAQPSKATAGNGGRTVTDFSAITAERAKTFQAALRASLTGREALTLPYADPDVTSLAEGYRPLLELADRQAKEATSQEFGAELAGGLVWPLSGRGSQAVANLAGDRTDRTLILSSSTVTATEGGTPPVHATVRLPRGSANALLTDDAISTALAAAGGLRPALAAQRLLAETAAITAADPGRSAVVLATVPRGWSPDPAGVATALSVLRRAPWVQLDRMGAAREQQPAAVGHARLPAVEASSTSRLPAPLTRTISNQLTRLDSFSTALRDKDAAKKITPIRRSALELLSTAWVSRQKGIGRAYEVLAEEVRILYDGVKIVAGSSTNMLTDSGPVPVTIDNTLDVPVTVYIDLHPMSGMVQVGKPAKVNIEAFKTRKVFMNLRAVANGDVMIESSLRLVNGTYLGNTSTINVRVRYDWEERGLTWVAGALVILLVAGLIRSVRRGRRVRLSPDSVPDPDDVGRRTGTDRDAPSPAAAASCPAVPAPTAAAAPRDDPEGDDSRMSPPTGPGTARLLSSSAIMAAGTLVSRVLGLARTAVLAWAIGQLSLSADAFATANTLPNSLMSLIAGGVLNAVLVPQIVKAAKRSDGGKDYLDRLLTLSILVLGGATLLALALAPVLVRLFGQTGWGPDQLELATAFALWCLPQIFFYGLYTIYGQVLNARGSFGPYMWAPAVNNVVAIAGTVLFIMIYGSGAKDPRWWDAGPIALFAGTATLGIVAQAVVLIPAMRRSGYRWRPRFGWRGIGLRSAGRVAGWTLAAAAVGQVGFVFISQAANSGSTQAAAEGATAAGRQIYDNAYLLFTLPHSLVAVSLVTAVFTRMSISAGAGRTDEVRADASLALRLTGVATVISTAAVLVLGDDITRAIFVGNDRAEATALATSTMAMVLGLVPFSAQYLFSRIFYSYEDARTPFWIQVASVVTWTGGSIASALLLPSAWIVPGIGLAMSVSNLVGAGLALWIVRRRLGGLDGGRLVTAHVRFVLAAALAAGVGAAARAGVHALAQDSVPGVYLSLLITGTVMIITYLGILRLLRAPELDQLLAPLRARMAR
jgi:putative peptidoglycan lipid II flippase